VSLPSVIEIVAGPAAMAAEITVPGSKSITNRALILGALGLGEVVLRDALWSEDTRVMLSALERLGFELSLEPETDEPGNRRIRIRGLGGVVPCGGTGSQPLDIFVGNAGTAARFLVPLACLGRGVYRFRGVPRMHERPQAALFGALRQLGYRIEAPHDRLPAVVYGTGARPGRCQVNIEQSSQFASGLLLCGPAAGWSVEIQGDNAEESPYVNLTHRLRRDFPRGPGEFRVEPDASSGSYFWAAGRQRRPLGPSVAPGADPAVVALGDSLSVRVRHWPRSGYQIDEAFPRRFWALAEGSPAFTEGAAAALPSAGPLPSRQLSRLHDLGDSIMTAIVLAPLFGAPTRFVELGRLRLQECERVLALRTELTKCGAKVRERGDTLEIEPSTLHGAEIETYGDHRLAMAFSVLGLKVGGIKIRDPACVSKTFPDFYCKLAAPPPQGLGALLLDAHRGRPLEPEELQP
jgi:3-phosphoshikimate 1-carboxyvinyltransferase